jgi:hypothetical protein
VAGLRGDAERSLLICPSSRSVELFINLKAAKTLASGAPQFARVTLTNEQPIGSCLAACGSGGVHPSYFMPSRLRRGYIRRSVASLLLMTLSCPHADGTWHTHLPF